jgi:hypothetical protein
MIDAKLRDQIEDVVAKTLEEHGIQDKDKLYDIPIKLGIRIMGLINGPKETRTS